MSKMADAMDGLISFQQELNTGMPVNILDEGYVNRLDEIASRKRYSYAKVINGEVQALATFGQEEPINGVDIYSVNYSVSEKHRGRGLAAEAVNKGIEELKKELGRSYAKSFYVDAIIDVTNTHSIDVAKKIFFSLGKLTKDDFTGTPARYFQRLITL